MANQEHVKVVTQGPEAFDRWRAHNPDTALDLEGADLSGVDLRGSKIRNANLRSADRPSAIANRLMRPDAPSKRDAANEERRVATI